MLIYTQILTWSEYSVNPVLLGTKEDSMVTVSAQLINRSSKGNPMVVVYREVNGRRTSIHRHLRREGVDFVGFNPDESAPRRQRLAEEALQRAKDAVTRTQNALDEATKAGSATKAEFKALKKAVADAKTALPTIDANLLEVRRQYPLKCKFTF